MVALSKHSVNSNKSCIPAQDETGLCNSISVRQLRVFYVTLQRMVKGQAGYTHVHEIINGLRNLGHVVNLFCPEYRSGGPSVPARLWAISVAILRFMIAALLNRPNIVYVRGHVLTLIIVVWSRLLGLSVVVEVNSSPDEIYVSWPGLRYVRRLLYRLQICQLNLATTVVTVTPQLVELVKNATNKDDTSIVVIPNAANVDLMRPIESPNLTEFGLDPGTYVIFVGALAPWQGIDVMLSAVQSPYWPHGIKLVICGGGQEVNKVVVGALQCDYVVYLGTVAYEKIPLLISGSIAGLAPKTDCGGTILGVSPLKVFEYLSCGRPAVVSDVAGLPEIIRHGKYGVVTRAGDHVALAKAVAWLVEHPEECRIMGEQARDYIIARHSWHERARQTEQLLKRVLGGKAV